MAEILKRDVTTGTAGAEESSPNSWLSSQSNWPRASRSRRAACRTRRPHEDPPSKGYRDHPARTVDFYRLVI